MISSCEYEYCREMASACSNKKILKCTLHGYPINVALGLCIAAAPDSADSVQFAELQVKQPNLLGEGLF